MRYTITNGTVSVGGQDIPVRCEEVPLDKAEIVDATPGISTTTVQRTLTDLVKAKKIIKIGNGRYTKYKWNWDKEN
jgi:hypothetical protein